MSVHINKYNIIAEKNISLVILLHLKNITDTNVLFFLKEDSLFVEHYFHYQ